MRTTDLEATMPDEAARHDLRQALSSAIGPDQAATLMEQLPPIPWDQLATKDDVRVLADRMDTRFELFEHKIVSEFRRQIIEQNRLLFFSMMGAIFTTASLAFAAARF
ncbi:MAG: hypothetical protein WEB03_11335 [Nitriliruptor sp.]|uniref:hypothetical protein n=1 Tax=Nitriliruptor sp. TaxID=2448056 RepID=UPI0034A04923